MTIDDFASRLADLIQEARDHGLDRDEIAGWLCTHVDLIDDEKAAEADDA